MKMSLKIRMTLILAVTSLFITLLAGFLAQIRWLSLLQRMAVSVAFFSFIGYLVGKWLESRLQALPEPDNHYKGENLDVISQPPQKQLESFDPFTVDQFERIERK